ncbi:MAG TPA: hypothetical protein ACFYEM_10850, partial [Candidatus Hypogeohydataceae bacterium YC40]
MESSDSVAGPLTQSMESISNNPLGIPVKPLHLPVKSNKNHAMELKELIFVIILPIVAVVIGVLHHYDLLKMRKKGGHPVTRPVPEGDVVYGNKVIHEGPTKDEIKETFKEVLRESGLSQPEPKEKIEKQIEFLKAELAQKKQELTQKELEQESERLEKAEILSVRGTERLEVENYEGAIEDLEGATKILPEGSEASLSAYYNLGIALIKFPRGDREANLKKAVESYKKVVSFHTREKTPERYAAAQNNLGNAYCGLAGVRDRESNLGLAIRACNEALRVYTFDK